MALKEGLGVNLREVGFSSASVRMNEAVLTVLGDQVEKLVGPTDHQKNAIIRYRTAMDKVIGNEPITAQEAALLEYLPWAIMGRLMGITSARMARTEVAWIENRDAILKNLGWEEGEDSMEKINAGIDKVYDRFEESHDVDMGTLIQDVMKINTALFPNTADIDAR